MVSGTALINEINATTPPPGHLAFWWLGQHGFAVRLGGKALYIDAFLSPHKARNIPPLLSGTQVTNADVVFGTHDHIDHIDRGTWPLIAAASPGAVFVVPQACLDRGLAGQLGIESSRFVGLDDGQQVSVCGLAVRGVASAHEVLSPDADTGRHPFLGYIIEADGLRVYHSGDCVKYDGLEARLRAAGHINLAMLPINGRDAVRFKNRCLGNMTFQEAAELAGNVGADAAIPTHFEMFPGNTEDPQKFADFLAVRYPAVRCIVPRHGCRRTFPGVPGGCGATCHRAAD